MKLLSFVIFFSILFSIHRKQEVGIVSYGYRPSDTAINIIKERIWNVYHLKSTYLGEDSLPVEGSYLYARAFHIGKYKTKRYSNIIGITESSLFVDIFTFEPIYGFSFIDDSKDNNTSIVSTRKWFDENDTTAANIIAHELGHQLRLNHCDDEKCLMYSTGNIEDSELCRNCRKMYHYLRGKP